MSFILTKLQLYIGATLLAVLVVFAGVQSFRLSSLQVKHAELELQIEKKRADDANAVLKDERQTAGKETEHAVQTTGAVNEFLEHKNARSAVASDNELRNQRLRIDAERRAATYRAQAQADAAARSDLADRLEAFDRTIVEGRQVVAGLRDTLAKRDSEVILLRKQIDADRALLEPNSP